MIARVVRNIERITGFRMQCKGMLNCVKSDPSLWFNEWLNEKENDGNYDEILLKKMLLSTKWTNTIIKY